jgi:hypothetical protein
MTVTDTRSRVTTAAHDVLPALSSDELRVLLRLAGATALPLEADPENCSPTDIADVVAARSLLARGLAQLVGAQLRIAPGAHAALRPVTPADRVVQVDMEVSGELHRHLLIDGNNRGLHLREREPDVWVVEQHADSSGDTGRAAATVNRTVLDLITSHVADSSSETTCTRIELDSQTHLQADATAFDGTAADVVQLLVVAGVEGGAATRWATALTQRDGAGAVRVANRATYLGSDPALTDEGIGWVAAGRHGLWRVVEHEHGATITTSDLATLRSDVRLALAGEIGRSR